MPRNTVMKDKLHQALKDTPRQLALDKRAADIKGSFDRRLHITRKPVPVPTPEPEIVETCPEPVIEVPQELPEQSLTEQTQFDQSAPFGPSLNAMVTRLRDARSRIAFTLEQAHTREEGKKVILGIAQAEYDKELAFIVGQKCKLGKIEALISACSMVDEESRDIATDLVAPSSRHSRSIPVGSGYTAESCCRRSDVLEVFQTNSHDVFAAADIVARLPVHKQDHARSVVPIILSTLTKENKIQRVSKGRYQSY